MCVCLDLAVCDVARRVEQERGAAGGAGGQAPAQLHAATGCLRAVRQGGDCAID